jgi:hypothetical protein
VRHGNVQSGIVRIQVTDYFLLVNDIGIQYSTLSKCRLYVGGGRFPGGDMKNPVEEVGSPDRQEGPGHVPASEVQRTLSSIQQSVPFRSSKQIQKLLQFLVSETLAGRAETLKERIIGVTVFDRRPDYDTNDDPIVRLRVAEVRKRLALFYQSFRDETVLISIPSGSFRAVFEWSSKSQLPVPADQIREPETKQPSVEPKISLDQNRIAVADAISPPARVPSLKWWVVAAASLAIVAFAAWRYVPSSEERDLNKFWSPVLENSNTVLIGIGNNPLYELSNAGEDEYYKSHPKTRFEEMGLHPYIPLSPGAIDSKYINPALNIYLTIGDVWALSRIEYILAQRNKKLDIRFVNDMAYGDLRQSPTILVGAHNNSWTMTMTENLRFGFQGHSTIVDRIDSKKQWTANFDRSETYGIVARVFNSWNGKVVIVIGGIGYSGTRAAGDFIANPQAISKLVKTLPKDWENKNIEVVLHTTVNNQVPSAPDVVAAYCW